MKNLPRYLIAAFFILLLFSIAEHIRTGNAGDKNWLLLATERWLNGQKLYVDIFEINPPLILFIFSIPAYISQHLLHTSDIHALAIFGLLVTGIVIAVSLSVIRRHPQFSGNRGRQTQFVLLLLFMFIFYAANNYFFDREFILVALTFPYMLRFLPQLRHQALPRPLSLGVGLLAAIGFCIKPHAAIIFGVIQLAFILRERSMAILYSLENTIVYLGGAAYLFCIWHFLPEYVTTVLPIALATYGNYKNSGLVYIAVNFLIFGVAFADFRPRRKTPIKPDIYYLLLVSAAYLVYAILNNGWGYTYYPLTIMGLFITAWVFWDHRYLIARDGPQQSFVFGSRACVVSLACNCAFAVLTLVSFFTVPSCDKNFECRKYTLLEAEMEKYHFHSFGVMSNDFTKWAQLGRSYAWETRFNHLWMIKSFVDHGPAFKEKNQWVLDYIAAAYAEDLDKNKPDAVFVVTNIGVRLPDFFGLSGPLKEAWSHYRFLHTLDLCGRIPYGTIMNPDCRYDVYERSR